MKNDLKNEQNESQQDGFLFIILVNYLNNKKKRRLIIFTSTLYRSFPDYELLN
jgi:hypothetical protein